MLLPISLIREMLISQDWTKCCRFKKQKTKGHVPKIKKVQESNSALEKPKCSVVFSHSKIQFVRA